MACCVPPSDEMDELSILDSEIREQPEALPWRYCQELWNGPE
jgi:hypothetical protein